MAKVNLEYLKEALRSQLTRPRAHPRYITYFRAVARALQLVDSSPFALPTTTSHASTPSEQPWCRFKRYV